MMMEGTLTVDSASLRNALNWTGQAPPGSGGFGRFALKARANLVGPSIALTNVNVELDGNVAEGVMTYANNGRQSLQATLAADTLDFTPYISTFRLLASGQHDWNRQLFDLELLSTTDLDMRLSAARVTVGPTKLGRTAFGANLRGGALALSVGEAQVYGGIAQGSFGLARADTMADVKAQFQFTDVDLQACVGELFGVSKLSGRGNLGVSLAASGSSPFGLASSLDGTATLTGHDGAISGFNVEQLLGGWSAGRSPARQSSLGLDALHQSHRRGEIRRRRRHRRGRPRRGPDHAHLDIRHGLGARARIRSQGHRQPDHAANAAPGFALPFVVQGPWDDPLIFPDPESLIRRSPASAPLLDAVKDRRTRDAVKSVLERFTGGGVKAAAPEAAAAPAPASAPAAVGDAKAN